MTSALRARRRPDPRRSGTEHRRAAPRTRRKTASRKAAYAVFEKKFQAPVSPAASPSRGLAARLRERRREFFSVRPALPDPHALAMLAIGVYVIGVVLGWSAVAAWIALALS